VKHAILGAGGVGGLVGASLAHEGEQVTLLLRPESLAQHPGYLRLEGPAGNFEAAVRIDAELREPVDVLWVTVKAYQLAAALQAVVPHGTSIGTIVPLLNGIDHVTLLRSRFDPKGVVPGTIAVESERVALGHIIQRSPFARLALSATGERQLEGVAALLRRAGFSCEFQADEKTMLWSKLAFLAPFALTTSAGNKSKQEICADSAWRARLESTIREACAVAAAEGATVDHSRILATIESLPPTMRSSMQKDVSAGRRPELDAIGGPIVRAGRAHRIDVPTTRELIARIEDCLSH
jgi:2-dehydropantoate 2-reductase